MSLSVFGIFIIVVGLGFVTALYRNQLVFRARGHCTETYYNSFQPFLFDQWKLEMAGTNSYDEECGVNSKFKKILDELQSAHDSVYDTPTYDQMFVSLTKWTVRAFYPQIPVYDPETQTVVIHYTPK